MNDMSLKNSLITLVTTFFCCCGCISCSNGLTKQDDPNAIVEITPEFIEKVQQYDRLAPFSEGRAAVRRGDKWGYINTKGEEVIECQFDRAEEFHEGISQVILEDKPYYINPKGEKLFYGEGGRFSQGLALLDDGRVVNPKGEEVFKINLNSMAYTMSRMPNQSSYTLYPYFIDGGIRVWTENDEKCFDLNGNSIPLRDHAEMSEQYMPFTEYTDTDEFDSGNHTGLKDNEGNIVIAPRYAEVSNFSNGVALVSYRENDAYFFGLDDEGTALRANDGMFETYTPRYYAYADLNGNTTFPQSTLDHIVEANRIGEERWKSILTNREVEKQREEEESKVCPEWIEGTWKWSGYVNGYNMGCAICFNRETGRYVMNTMDGDTELGTFTYDADKRLIRCRPNNSNGYTISYEVDIYGERISLGDGHYFKHIGS